MYPRVLLAAIIAIALVGGTVLISGAVAGHSSPAGSRAITDVAGAPAPRSPSPTPEPREGSEQDPEAPNPQVSVSIDGFLAWAALDRTTGDRLASANATETNSMESMIKVWLVADHLRRTAKRGEEPSERDLRDARLAIRQSHNGAAQRLYVAGGQDRVVERMIDICELRDTLIPEDGSGWWSRTEMSAEDAVRLGECIADGSAAGPEWTEWVLAEMEQVKGGADPSDQRPEEGFEGGRWGIIDGLPESTVDEGVSIKNGWTRIGADNSWHVNCLAITTDWVIAVMMRYPAERSLEYGAKRCAAVARKLVDGPLTPVTAPGVA